MKQCTSKDKTKQVKLECHHKDGISSEAWERLIDLVYEHILPHPDNLQPLCKDCHGEFRDITPHGPANAGQKLKNKRARPREEEK